MAQANERVRFDFSGSLLLAKRLWSLADDLASEDADRAGDAELALAKWRGALATEFAERRATEASNRDVADAALRADARQWAQNWAEAMNEQNRRNRAAKVTELRDARSGWAKFSDKYLWTEDDSDERVGAADTVSVPIPPSFEATATEQRF